MQETQDMHGGPAVELADIFGLAKAVDHATIVRRVVARWVARTQKYGKVLHCMAWHLP